MTAVAQAPGIRLTLREYQEQALDRVAAAEARGVRKQLGVAATGLGKTVIFCALAERRQARTLILAHRDELVAQAAAKVREIWPGVDVGIVKAGQNEVHAQVVVASVQTLAREARLAQLVDAHEREPWRSMLAAEVAPFDLVIVDEAHHTAADTYRRILDRLDAGTTDGPLLLGVTATPDRGDGKGLDDLFDEITWTFDILWGIRSGYLCDVRGKRVTLAQLDLTNVKLSRGDYQAGASGRAMEDADAPELIVKAWREHAATRQTLVFTPTVALAHAVAEEYRHHGINAAALSGATPMEERRDLLARYAAGEVQVIANCAVLTEGYDNPRTDCIVVARPTKSRALYTQMVGRGTRKHPDKTDLLVLDVVGATEEHSLVTIPSLFGLDKKHADRMGDGTGLLTDEVASWEQQQVKAGILRAEDVELFTTMRAQGTIAWVAIHDPGENPRYVRPAFYRDASGTRVDLPTVVLTRRGDSEDSWLAGIIDTDGSKRVLIADADLSTVQGVGEDFIRKTMPRAGFIDAAAPWRKRKPSPRQRELAKRMRLNVADYKTAGELSDAIDAQHIRRKAKR